MPNGAGKVVAAALPPTLRRGETPGGPTRPASAAAPPTVETPGVAGPRRRTGNPAIQRTRSEIASGLTRAPVTRQAQMPRRSNRMSAQIGSSPADSDSIPSRTAKSLQPS